MCDATAAQAAIDTYNSSSKTTTDKQTLTNSIIANISDCTDLETTVMGNAVTALALDATPAPTSCDYTSCDGTTMDPTVVGADFLDFLMLVYVRYDLIDSSLESSLKMYIQMFKDNSSNNNFNAYSTLWNGGLLGKVSDLTLNNTMDAQYFNTLEVFFDINTLS